MNFIFRLLLGQFLLLAFSLSDSLAAEARVVSACPDTRGKLIVSILNVGQGDATLIQCPDGQTQTLLDAGESQSRYPNAEKLLLTALSQRLGNDKTIENAIATHPHQDHLFGFASTLPDAGYSFARYFDNGADNPDSTLEEQIREKLLAKGGSYVDLSRKALDSILLCPKSGIRLRLLQHTEAQDHALDCPRQLNDCSLLSRLDYRGVSFLFMADSLLARETVLLEEKTSREFLANAHVMSGGHHGSGSSSLQLLRLVRPWFLTLSTGMPGKGTTSQYAFPEHEVLGRIQNWFEESGRKIKVSQAQPLRRRILGCKRSEGACRWTPSELPWNAWSTAVSGSLDFLVQDNFMCVSSDLRTNNIEFRF